MPVISTVRTLVAGIALLISLGLAWLQPTWIIGLDDSVRDAAISKTAMTTPEERVVVVDIDESSLSRIGPWPWPRSRIADLIEALLQDLEAKVVGLDIVFPNPSDAEGDIRLATLALHTPLVVAQAADYVDRAEPLRVGQLSTGTLGEGQLLAMQGKLDTAVPARGHIANHAGLSSARCAGNIGYIPDADGILRRLPVVTAVDSILLPTLSAAMVACTEGTLPVVTTDERGLWRVPYKFGQEAYTVLSAADVLAGAIPRELIRGRYVLIGSSAVGLGDQVTTPLASLTSGVMVHAAALSGLLDAKSEHREGPPFHMGLAWIAAWSLATIALARWLLPRLDAWRSVALLCILATAWLCQSLFSVRWASPLPVTPALWGYGWMLIASIPLEWSLTQAKTRRLMNTLEHYVSKPVVDEIIRQNLDYSLQPRREVVTAMVVDLEGYTRTTSQLSLEEAASLTKLILECMTKPVFKHNGTLDRYAGDGLVAFWGAPLKNEKHADDAVSAAKEILRAFEELNKKRVLSGKQELHIRIGIESGEVLVGDFGNDLRSTYTAVGDCINFASRLEKEARQFGHFLLVGPTAAKLLHEHETVPLGSILLPRTDTILNVFTVHKGERRQLQIP